jgi:hypothetical protein
MFVVTTAYYSLMRQQAASKLPHSLLTTMLANGVGSLFGFNSF